MKLNSPLTLIKCFIGKKSRTTEDVYLSDFFQMKMNIKKWIYILYSDNDIDFANIEMTTEFRQKISATLSGE